MWVLFAFGSAMLAGLTSVLAKCGIKKTDSTVATAIRTIVVLIFSWLMVFVVGSQETISAIGGRTLLFLVLSGLATGASWLCYFKALQLGDVNKVVPIDKSSTVLTILLAAIFLQEGVSLTKGIGVVLIAVGTFLMIEKKQSGGETKSAAWLWYALGSAVFASLTAILGKVGISGVESNLGTAIRTGVVLLMSWVMVFVTGKQGALKAIPKNELFFICLSGLATGGSWLCYYKALQDGPASVVVPIDKLSILVTALGKDVDKIRGLGFGADDYIEKPFSPSVLVARVKAHLAQYHRLKPQTAAAPKLLTVGPLSADPAQHCIRKNDAELALKNKEYELLLFLMRHPGQVFSREDLYEMIWGLESMGDNITVAVHMNRLREKIEDDPSHPTLLQTVWGVGYRLNKGER